MLHYGALSGGPHWTVQGVFVMFDKSCIDNGATHYKTMHVQADRAVAW